MPVYGSVIWAQEDATMKMTELFLADLEREAATNRRVLERVPEGRDDWKPHAKSMPMGYLAALVATMPGWIEMMVNQDQFDLTEAESKYKPKVFGTHAGLLAALDDAVARARKALEDTTDEHLLTAW
jgi:hypothetical protein